MYFDILMSKLQLVVKIETVYSSIHANTTVMLAIENSLYLVDLIKTYKMLFFVKL